MSKKNQSETWKQSYSQFLEKQNQQFLQKVQGQSILFKNDTLDLNEIYLSALMTNPTNKSLAYFSKDGKQLNILHNSEILYFNQSHSPNHGIYQSRNKQDILQLYAGIVFCSHNLFLYFSDNSNQLFKSQEKQIFLIPKGGL